MPISELGYRHWEGKRTRPTHRWLAIAKSEISIAYKSSKLLRRFLFFAWAPILYFCPFFLAIGFVADPANDLESGSILTEIAKEFFSKKELAYLRENPTVVLPAIWSVGFFFFFTYTQSFLALIVVAIVGPSLISKDLRSKAFLVYFSKPIQPWQYLLGKLTAVIFFVFSITLFPALLLYVVSIALSPDAGTLVATLPILWKVLVTSILISVPLAMVVLAISSLTKDRRIATFSWVAVCIFGEIAFRILTVSGNFSQNFKPPAWASLLSLRELTTTATSGIFELRQSLELLVTKLATQDGRMERSVRDLAGDLGDARMEGPRDNILDIASTGLSPIVAIAVLVGICACCAPFVLRRVTKPVRI